MTEQLDGVDFGLVAFLDDGEWQVQELAPATCESVDTLVEALHRLPEHDGALAMVAVDDDFFVLVRANDATPRVLLSDITAAEDWDLAASVLEFLGVSPGDEEEPVPAGDLDLLHELGMATMDMAILLEDDELYPDEQLAEIARVLGFGDEFDDAAGMAPA